MDIFDEDAFSEYVKTRCWSCWDGCCCELLRDHDGLHECAASICDCTWTDEQAEEFEEHLRSL